MILVFVRHVETAGEGIMANDDAVVVGIIFTVENIEERLHCVAGFGLLGGQYHFDSILVEGRCMHVFRFFDEFGEGFTIIVDESVDLCARSRRQILRQ